MHIESAMISTAVAGGAMLSQTGALAHSVKKVAKDIAPKKILLAGIAGACVFSAQMLNFTIPVVGSSGHIVGGIFLAALLGPNVAFIVMSLILSLQCLLFGDGGLMALGCNIFNMGFISCYLAYPLIVKPFMKKLGNKKGITIGSFIGSIASLEFGALCVVLETSLSGISELPFSLFAVNILPIHLAIGAIEGIVTGAVLSIVYKTDKEILNGNLEKANTNSVMKSMGIASLAIGGILSQFASHFPDGLEWSVKNVAGAESLSNVSAVSQDSVHIIFDKIQSATTLLPDYAFKTVDTFLGTSFSGIVGCTVIISVFAVISYMKNHKLNSAFNNFNIK